jgi:hypothetical protein
MTPSDNVQPLAYVLAESTAAGETVLREAVAPALSPTAWQELAAGVAREPSLTPFPAELLRERWEQGHAALMIQDDAIVAYTSVVPVFSEVTRQALAAVLDLPPSRIPVIDVYESMTGWTAPMLRKKGISLRLRRPLLARFAGPNCLFIGFTAGMGASPVLSRMDWQVTPWSQITFAGSIIENSTVDCTSGSPRGWHVRGLKPYDGPPTLTYLDSTHDWASYCYFWISDAGLGQRLDRQLAELVGGDVCRWRELWGRVVESTLLKRGWIPIVLDT